MPSRSGRNTGRSKRNSRSSSPRSSSGSRGRAASSRSKSSSSGTRSRGASSRSGSTSRSRTRSKASSRSTSHSRASRSSASSRPLMDHEEIRQWAEERGARPACVRGTGGREDIGMIRLDFPGYSGERSLEHIEWDEWFDKFDDSGLALLVQETTARRQKSNFNKLVSRGTAEHGGRGRKSSSGGRGASSRKRAA
jgi:hypothetical protein